MPMISLPAFLKILTKGTPQKMREYGKYLTPGGYDFYHLLKEAAHNITVGGGSYSESFKTIDDIPRDVEKKYNLEALKSLEKWIKKHNPTDFFEGPVGLITSPAGHLSVKLEPEFGAVLNGERRLLQVWYSKEINLSKTAISLGRHLLEKHLCKDEFADCKAGILDLRRKEVMVHEVDDIAMDLMLSSELAWVDNFFKSQKEVPYKAAVA